MLLLLAPIALGGIVTLLVYIVVICLVAWLFYWLINYIGPPEPIKKIAVVILVVVFVIVLLYLLLGAVPMLGR
jgi:Kef-type K+ transport system membrane component KefB